MKTLFAIAIAAALTSCTGPKQPQEPRTITLTLPAIPYGE